MKIDWISGFFKSFLKEQEILLLQRKIELESMIAEGKNDLQSLEMKINLIENDRLRKSIQKDKNGLLNTLSILDNDLSAFSVATKIDLNKTIHFFYEKIYKDFFSDINIRLYLESKMATIIDNSLWDQFSFCVASYLKSSNSKGFIDVFTSDLMIGGKNFSKIKIKFEKINEYTNEDYLFFHTFIKPWFMTNKIINKVVYGKNKLLIQIYFPAKIEANKPKIINFPTGGTGKILLIEDDHQLLKSMSQFLHMYGYEIETSSNAIEALERFKNDFVNFSLIITDDRMPGMTGSELIFKILKIDEFVKSRSMLSY